MSSNVDGRRMGRGALWLICAALASLALPAAADAANPPTHPLLPSPIGSFGLDHACGTAVDSQGDIYVSNAGESKVEIFDVSGTHLASIADAHEPCGLAVNGQGELFVSEKALGDVVRYTPNAYPLGVSPTYGAAEAVDGSGLAQGIAVDPIDERLYVAEDTRIAVYRYDGSFETHLGEGSLSEATGVAAYTYSTISKEEGFRYVSVADKAESKLKLFGGEVRSGTGTLKDATSLANPVLQREINGPKEGEAFGFGTAGAYLAFDAGNGNAEEKCTQVAEQACTAGHLLVYDHAHQAVDEFDASGEFLDQVKDPELTDAEPTGMAVDRSGGANDGRVYVSSGAGAGAKLLAFGPLTPPGRAPLGQEPPEPPSHVLPTAAAAATDSSGDLYVATAAAIHVYSGSGVQITEFPDGEHPYDLAVDSKGRVYIIDEGQGIGTEKVTYYTPSSYPPSATTAYGRHEPPILRRGELSGGRPQAIAVDPASDRLFVTTGEETAELGSADEGSMVVVANFAGSIVRWPISGMGICGRSGEVFFAGNRPSSGEIVVVNATGTEAIARITGAGSPAGLLPHKPAIAIEQDNCHVVAFDPSGGAAREYDARGGFVAEFGHFGGSGRYDVTIDNSGGANKGTAYVVRDEAVPNTPDVWAFAPLSYGGPPIARTGLASGIGGGHATLHGTVNPEGFEVEECRFEYLKDSVYQENLEAEEPPFEGATFEECAETPAHIGKGDKPVPVHAEVGGLEPEGRYRFRLVATNKFGESEGSTTSTGLEAGLFGPPALGPESALALYDEAILHAEVEPAGLETQYRFEYVTQAHYEEKGFEEAESTLPKVLSPGEALVAVQAGLHGLPEGATYHYRLVAENEAATVRGPGRFFTTLQRRGAETCPNAEYRTGPSAGLPDCRAYELITPPETAGLSPLDHTQTSAGFDDWLTVPGGEAAGDRLSFFTQGTIPGFEGDGQIDGYLAERGAGEHPAAGWSTAPSGPSYPESGGSMPFGEGLAADQLYSAWHIGGNAEGLEDALAPGLYLRAAGQTAGSPCNPQPLQSDFESFGCGALGTDPGAIVDYIGSGGTRLIFSSKEALEAEAGNQAAPKGTEAIYERKAGSAQAHILSLKPDGGPFAATEDAVFLSATEDGGAVVFGVGEALYVRRGGTTSEIVASNDTLAGISQDGSRVFYTDKSNPREAAGLWACDLEAGPCAGAGAHPATEVGPSGSMGLFASVSADGSHVLFSSEEALSGAEENEKGEKAQALHPNLYSWDGATTRFLGILDASDLASFQGLSDVSLGNWYLAASDERHGSGGGGARATSPTRSTPDGRVFLFQSHARLTGYDNEGVAEVYRYDPSAEAGERLLCLSCSPAGASPRGEATLQDLRPHRPASARSTLIPNLTEDGNEAFFQSPDRLVPEDANEAQDVYEWRARGTTGPGGDACTRPGGCLALISSGQGEGDSYLYSMTSSGRDVFFWTEEKLVPADAGASRSIYDARVVGGIPEPSSPAPCQGDACQGQGSQSPSLPGPATTGSGKGNAALGRKPCGKGRRRVKGRCVAKHHSRHRRRAKHHIRGRR